MSHIKTISCTSVTPCHTFDKTGVHCCNDRLGFKWPLISSVLLGKTHTFWNVSLGFSTHEEGISETQHLSLGDLSSLTLFITDEEMEAH